MHSNWWRRRTNSPPFDSVDPKSKSFCSRCSPLSLSGKHVNCSDDEKGPKNSRWLIHLDPIALLPFHHILLFLVSSGPQPLKPTLASHPLYPLSVFPSLPCHCGPSHCMSCTVPKWEIRSKRPRTFAKKSRRSIRLIISSKNNSLPFKWRQNACN